MRIHLGVEDIDPNNWVAWVFEYPGCYSRGGTTQEALTQVEMCVREHVGRLQSLGIWSGEPFSEITPVEFEIVQEIRSYSIDQGTYYVHAFFEDDYRPIDQSDMVNSLSLMFLNRIELINTVRPLESDDLDRLIPDDQHSCIREILRHIAATEWWCLDRIDRAFDRSRCRPDVFEFLQQVREHTSAVLPETVGETFVTEKRQERWSPRKVLRRVLANERMRTLEIQKYLKATEKKNAPTP